VPGASKVAAPAPAWGYQTVPQRQHAASGKVAVGPWRDDENAPSPPAPSQPRKRHSPCRHRGDKGLPFAILRDPTEVGETLFGLRVSGS